MNQTIKLLEEQRLAVATAALERIVGKVQDSELHRRMVAAMAYIIDSVKAKTRKIRKNSVG